MTSVVTDPEGDMDVRWSAGTEGPAYLDIVRVEVSKKGGSFVFTMEVAGRIPETPELAPLGVSLLQWGWGLSTLEANPCGFPLPPPWCIGAEYTLSIWWDGTRFTGNLIDRIPLLTGGEAILTPLSFTIKGAELKMSVDAAMVGDPSSFLWGAATIVWSPPLTPLGNWGFFHMDSADEATWPA